MRHQPRSQFAALPADRAGIAARGEGTRRAVRAGTRVHAAQGGLWGVRGPVAGDVRRRLGAARRAGAGALGRQLPGGPHRASYRRSLSSRIPTRTPCRRSRGSIMCWRSKRRASRRCGGRCIAEAGRRVAANYGLDPRLGKYHRTFCLQCGNIAAARAAGGGMSDLPERRRRAGRVGPGRADSRYARAVGRPSTGRRIIIRCRCSSFPAWAR